MKNIYKKNDSFEIAVVSRNDNFSVQKARALKMLKAKLEKGEIDKESRNKIFKEIYDNLLKPAGDIFKITSFIAAEMALINKERLLDYLYHRWRYDVFPMGLILNDYPPCLQIELASHCNYKCIFCFQKNPYFKAKENMGMMKPDAFRRIIDMAEGNIAFVTLASRGEPLLNKNLPGMLNYCKGKFLNLKINTNASLLTEKYAHAILSSDLHTLVFSVDSSDPEEYSRLRVNGILDNVVKNIRMFNKVKEEYPERKIITRVSGVYMEENQNIDSMVSFWGDKADQISFVKYNPWENIYGNRNNGILVPCSDLWRRMFIWFDGKVNPCDCDFKSTLSVGNVFDGSIKSLWTSEKYRKLREKHLNNKRQEREPCCRCSFI